MSNPHNHTPSSQAAAAQKSNASTERDRVEDYALSLGSQGSTNEEACAALSMKGDTLRPRRWELVDSGRVVITPRKRLTAKNREADVWVHPSFATKQDVTYTKEYLLEKRAKSKATAQAGVVLREELERLVAKHGSKPAPIDKVIRVVFRKMDKLGL